MLPPRPLEDQLVRHVIHGVFISGPAALQYDMGHDVGIASMAPVVVFGHWVAGVVMAPLRLLARRVHSATARRGSGTGVAGAPRASGYSLR